MSPDSHHPSRNAGARDPQPDAASPAGPADDLLSSSPWAWWRAQMPVSDTWAYLDHAAVGPLSQPAGEALHRFADQAVEQGDTVWPQWARRLEQLRGEFAELLTVQPEEVCLLPNTTTGINLIAEGFPWNAGDSVVVPEGEFPSNLFPWLNQRHRGVDVRVVPRRGGEVRIDDLMQHVDSSTRLIAASWVGFASGYRLDVEALVEQAHRRGVLVLLDAIQGLGVYPLDLSEVPVDFLAADGHKWLLGPEGAGVGVIRREHLERLRCPTVGWHSVQNASQFSGDAFQLRDDAARFEGGSANMVGMAALAASVELFLQVKRQHGAAAIGQRVLQLAGRLEAMLSDCGATTRLAREPDRRSGIVTFDLPATDPAEVRRVCLERNVVVSVRDGGVRASIHAYNNEEDLSRLVDAVRAAAA